MNKSLSAYLSRGFDLKLANDLLAEGYTLNDLKSLSRPDLLAHIHYTKDVWQKEVERLDAESLAVEFKELHVIPIRLSRLKQRWFNFFKKLGWEIQLVEDPFKKVKYDFYVTGIM